MKTTLCISLLLIALSIYQPDNEREEYIQEIERVNMVLREQLDDCECSLDSASIYLKQNQNHAFRVIEMLKLEKRYRKNNLR